MASHTRDDAFHEIQLNGKQLVFLFMAVTVASVVIFLCGVLVGRGVRGERGGIVAEIGDVTPSITPEPARSQPAPAPVGSDPRAAAPPQAGGDLSYPERLGEKNAAPAEHLKPAADKPAPEKVVSPPTEKITRNSASPEKAATATGETRSPAPPPAAPAPKQVVEKQAPAVSPAATADAPAAEPSGQGFALQITALREPGEAEAIARRLSAKGYAAYILKPAAGTPAVYRVRVGKFKTRREAEAIATKLHKEEQFSPWITR